MVIRFLSVLHLRLSFAFSLVFSASCPNFNTLWLLYHLNYTIWDCTYYYSRQNNFFPPFYIPRIYNILYIQYYSTQLFSLSHKLHLKDTRIDANSSSWSEMSVWEEGFLTVVEHLQRCRYVKIIWQPRGSSHPPRGRIYLATFVTALDRSLSLR